MITIEQAEKWLNWEMPSKLDRNNKRLVQEMRAGSRNKGSAIYQYFLNYINVYNPPIDLAEILIYCSLYQYERGQFSEAIDRINRAVEVLNAEEDNHRLAIANWLSFHFKCSPVDPDQAYGLLRTAISHFNNQACFYTYYKDTDRVKWYRDRMVDTAIEIISSVRGTYGCLFEYDKSHLCFSADQTKSRIMQQINRRKKNAFESEIAFLKSVTKGSLDWRETTEVYIISGLTTGICKEPSKTIHEFRSALAQCTPESHDHVFIRWMLARYLLSLPSMYGEAIRNMEICIRHIDALVTEADHQARLSKKIWYEAYREAMKRLLIDHMNRISFTTGRFPDIHSIPNVNPPNSSPSIEEKQLTMPPENFGDVVTVKA